MSLEYQCRDDRCNKQASVKINTGLPRIIVLLHIDEPNKSIKKKCVEWQRDT
jgi:hypothetical protein